MHRVTVGTAGHIDHGKTTLVAALTGIDCDRWAEEKRRGITIDLGFAHLVEDQLQVSFVDVPGHERFVHNALAGLGGIRMMILVVAADEGVEPQTREHLQICSLLGIPAGLAVLTKADLVEPDLLELAVLELEEELRGTPFEGAPILTASSVTGEGIERVRREIVRLAGAVELESERLELPVRLPVDRAFHLRGLGVLVTGTMAQGTVRVGDSLEVLPGAGKARVRSIQVHGDEREQAVAGERTSLQLGGIELAATARGHQIVEPDSFLVAKRFLVKLRLLDDAPGPIRGFLPVRFHLLSSERIGKLRPVDRPRVEPGEEALCELRIDEPVVAVRGDRFVVRRPSPQTTLGGGTILDPDWIGTRGSTRARVLRALADSDAAALEQWVERGGEGGATASSLARRLGRRRRAVEEMLRERVASGALLETPSDASAVPRWLCPSVYRRISSRARRTLEQYFEVNRMAVGMPKAEALSGFLTPAGSALAEVYLAWLEAEGVLCNRGDRLDLPGRGDQLTTKESKLAGRIVAAFESRGLAPPALEEIRAEVNAERRTFEGVLKYLSETGKVTRLPSGLFIATVALERLRVELLETSWERFSVGEFKDRFGLTRKWAIPLLEYLDARGATRRVGDQRAVVRPRRAAD